MLCAYEQLYCLHGEDARFPVNVQHEEFALLLVCELLRFLDGLLLSKVEEPIFEKNDNFFHKMIVI